MYVQVLWKLAHENGVAHRLICCAGLLHVDQLMKWYCNEAMYIDITTPPPHPGFGDAALAPIDFPIPMQQSVVLTDMIPQLF